MTNRVLDGVMGLCVADALGVPVEFKSRETLTANPVIGMREYGTYNQPAGTWSDDTSMTLCLMDSLTKKLDYDHMMANFIKWYRKGEYTPFGEVFDIGIATEEALHRFENGTPPLECGGSAEYDNGNGSLMRILPILFYLESMYGNNFQENEEAFHVIHDVSALTHAHKRSQIACNIYISIASQLSNNEDLQHAVGQGLNEAVRYYEKHSDCTDELTHFDRLRKHDFSATSIEEINSSGYVVDTLEAAIWCLLTTESYQECVLKAVNLGEDTDTVAAVAGGLAGLYYGYENIPEQWLNAIVKREYIEELCNKLYHAMLRNSFGKLEPFIPYFETATKESVVRWGGGKKLGEKRYILSYPSYDETLVEFTKEVYKTNLICHDYFGVLKKYVKNDSEMLNAIQNANIKLLQAILTNYIRQERFSDGLWATAVEQKVFLRILRRLEELAFSG